VYIYREREIARERERQTDGLTDMTKLKIAFSNYTNVPIVQQFNAVFNYFSK